MDAKGATEAQTCHGVVIGDNVPNEHENGLLLSLRLLHPNAPTIGRAGARLRLRSSLPAVLNWSDTLLTQGLSFGSLTLALGTRLG